MSQNQGTSTTDNRVTFEDFIDSLTGIEENLIERHYGATFDALLRTQHLDGPSRLARAVAFVFRTRDGVPPEKAKAAIERLTRKQIADLDATYFVDDETAAAEREADLGAEFNDEEPVTERGKDDGAPE